MKSYVLLFFFLIPSLLLVAQSQEDCDLTNYNRLIREAEEYAYGKNGKAVNYKKAIDKLFSARTCQPEKESEVSRKILEVFEKVNGERNRAEKALADLKQSNAEVVKLLLKNTDREILNLNYESALTIIKSAATLQAAKQEVTKSWLEIAFWHAESGDSLRAIALLDSIADFAEVKISSSKPLREQMKAIDGTHFEYLFESKYYPEMVFVEGGTFWMGRDTTIDPGDVGEETLHQQEVSSFWIAKYETTVWQFALFWVANGKDFDEFLISTWTDPGNNPVVNVSWIDAIKYANWVSKQKGHSLAISDDYSVNLESKGYRLPTEAEWEFAAKGGRPGMNNLTIYSGSNNLDSVGWFGGNVNIMRTRPVGQKKANPLGLYDMSGNVWEWCWDWYDGYPGSLEMANYLGPDSGLSRVMRGGSWNFLASFCRVSFRLDYPDIRRDDYGFRLSRTH